MPQVQLLPDFIKPVTNSIPWGTEDTNPVDWHSPEAQGNQVAKASGSEDVWGPTSGQGCKERKHQACPTKRPYYEGDDEGNGDHATA